LREAGRFDAIGQLRFSLPAKEWLELEESPSSGVRAVSITKSAKLHDHFTELADPRRRKVTYPLINIVVIAVCAVICGADDFVAIAEFGEKKREWFAKFLDLQNGIPSHDRFNAVVAAIKPAEFEKCFLSWIAALQDITDGQVVAIDGKTLRRSFDAASGKSAIHMVGAWATANQISLGQVVVDAKSNEITAIPKLLEMLEISGCLVTIDAMGRQTEIARKIVGGKADYALHVKGHADTNFSTLRRAALSMLKNESSLKVGVKNKRLAAGWDGAYLEKVLLG
jgi:predicted transposase YbfD/YdcC